MKNSGQFLKNGAIQGVLLLNAFIMVYPLFVMLISSFKTNAEIFTSPFALPHSFSLANAEKVWTDTNFIFPPSRDPPPPATSSGAMR